VLFSTTLSAEYVAVASTYGLGGSDMVALARRSIDDAFCRDNTKAYLRARFDREVAALVIPLGDGCGRPAGGAPCAQHPNGLTGVATKGASFFVGSALLLALVVMIYLAFLPVYTRRIPRLT